DRTQVQVDARHQALLRHRDQTAPFVYVTTKPETTSGGTDWGSAGIGAGAARSSSAPDPQRSAARRSASWSSRAAGPGAPSPIALLSSSTTGITSRMDEDVKASFAAATWSSGKTPSRTSYPAAPASSR